jgi:hypothetical protein
MPYGMVDPWVDHPAGTDGMVVHRIPARYVRRRARYKNHARGG